MATYTLISSNVLASSAASVTFSSIPATYTDLVLKVSARSDDSAVTRALTIAVNGGTNLSSYTYLLGNGATIEPGNGGSQDSVQLTSSLNSATSTSNTFNNAEIYFPNYLSTGSKPMSAFAVTENKATTAVTSITAGLYRTTSAINTITVSLNTAPTNKFVANSSFYLYGISNT